MWFSMAFHGQRLVYQQLFCDPTTTAWDLCFSHGSGSASWEIRDLAEDRSTASHCGPKSGISMDLTWPNQANLGVWWCVCHGFMVFLRSCFFCKQEWRLVEPLPERYTSTFSTFWMNARVSAGMSQLGMLQSGEHHPKISKLCVFVPAKLGNWMVLTCFCQQEWGVARS